MSKTETIQALKDARAQIIALANALPVEKRDEVFLGIWSAQDLLAHLVGWDFANIDSVKEIREGKSPRVFKYYDAKWASFNARLVQEHKRADWDEMMLGVRHAHDALVEFLAAVPDADFDRDFGVRSPRGRSITITVHLQAEIDDEIEHAQQLKDWLAI